MFPHLQEEHVQDRGLSPSAWLEIKRRWFRFCFYTCLVIGLGVNSFLKTSFFICELRVSVSVCAVLMGCGWGRFRGADSVETNLETTMCSKNGKGRNDTQNQGSSKFTRFKPASFQLCIVTSPSCSILFF